LTYPCYMRYCVPSGAQLLAARVEGVASVSSVCRMQPPRLTPSPPSHARHTACTPHPHAPSHALCACLTRHHFDTAAHLLPTKAAAAHQPQRIIRRQSMPARHGTPPTAQTPHNSFKSAGCAQPQPSSKPPPSLHPQTLPQLVDRRPLHASLPACEPARRPLRAWPRLGPPLATALGTIVCSAPAAVAGSGGARVKDASQL